MDALVLAGGNASRLGGVDKATLEVGGRTLLERTLDATRGSARTIVVGPRRPTSRPVLWVREEPPGGGPVAGLAAGLALVTSDLVAVVAVDLPHLASDHLDMLLAAAGERDGAIFVDALGRDQPLAGVYRAVRLSSVLAGMNAHGAAMGAVVERLDLTRVQHAVAAQDCDTPEDVATARRVLERG